ncbi:Sno1p [Saccharomyces cerevisiae YJM1419]|uniref:Pyridoxal 5'-phosphate synthase glutaminase subunit n=1 Tax=Saccharomyces cerevisiae (strain YJM789) TaxID=307796 RepID=A6ZMF2_YEAS7|nr:Sno1p [Saccharomyces cerevisiae YJM326]AJS65885.1 Sno1p [Saccharomyces cerevisiae YJM428]AJS66762.1 Sno1p [Saccharomyces cerevisiae YJM451]AJS70709.1 Sno1p [Saccharomyces cerevisiae YJM682]AJS71144.1 Sno1p [Saccharomyces cerevisiae YJM683]AJS76389.1 Sno1p [Saccharomyces cerevisiae YJM1083]AJS87714.1 Sno1p [Saccharomyces cerevisiae YJM1385]AJS92957.1 Sno1p [Saccharomyces cerevisiae YJM1419]AJS93394.1 Sno1p [Saccharomyces cerevisiae YJM1433]AJS96422.1 Sno1p [Saccharomyces cerevisiae YJM14
MHKTHSTMSRKSMKVIGVLALQGAFLEHTNHLKRCLAENDYGIKIEIKAVKTPEDLAQCDALIIPGGESTSMSLIAQRTGLYPCLYEFVHNPEKVVWGTCAGLIFLSAQLENESALVKTLGVLKVDVRRNAFGRQAQSFTQKCDFSNFIPGCDNFPATFIRAPVIERILDPIAVKSLYELPVNGKDVVVAATQNHNILVTSFHPELADSDTRFHDWFIRQFVSN